MRLLILAVGVVSLMCLLPEALNAAEEGLPRYSLPAGRRLTYSGQDKFKYTNGELDSTSTFQVTVVGQNPDGSIRLIVRTGTSQIQTVSGQAAPQTVAPALDFAYTLVDITPDGRLVSAQGGFNPQAPMVIPPLPADSTQLGGTWKDEPKIPGQTKVFSSAGPIANGMWTFNSSTEGIFKTIYGISNESTFHFDIAKGMVASIDSQSRQTYGFHGAGTGSTQLLSDEKLSSEEIAPLAKDVAALLSAREEYSKKLESLYPAKDDIGRFTADVKAALSNAAAGASTPEIKSQFDQMLASADQDIQSTVDDDKRFAAVKGKPAPDFVANDMEGQPHALRYYRGKVVVLDFWYRGCGWCMRAMPGMKQVADDFKDKPVVVLGLNTDRDIANAKFVIDAMKLNYQTLRIDQNVASKFNVRAFPSLLIIDPAGIVREFDEGYSPTLRADLDRKIQELLSEAK
jgi:thiol-disulfide isomerase/thioredoxin